MLNKLIIKFQSVDDFFSEVSSAIESGTGCVDDNNTITFDAYSSYKQLMTANRVNILTTISKFKPNSIYELAKILGRRAQHVATDCKYLAFHGFIKRIKSESSRKQIRPELAFDYDVIFTANGEGSPLLISTKSEKVLAEAAGFTRAI